MIKILTIVGARPQIIKAAAISRCIRNNFSQQIKEYILHTGQHYDEKMSEIFFTELNIPRPDFNLNVGSSNHGDQTAKMIVGIEKVLEEIAPNFLLVYGDTNSTLAGAIAASKLHIPIIHVEAGLRSFNKRMPEEINRILCDHISTLLFSPTETGVNNLKREGFVMDNVGPFSIDNPKVFHSGDIMFDNSLYFAQKAKEDSKVFEQNGLLPNEYMLCTIHRDNNTDDPQRLNAIFSALQKIQYHSGKKVILPLHPRTKKILPLNLANSTYHQIMSNENILLVEPVSFLDMIQLEANASLILTDSGGVQKEAFFFEKPCVILRPQTEWVELTQNGTAILADADENKIIFAYNSLINNSEMVFSPIFGNGNAANLICTKIMEYAKNA